MTSLRPHPLEDMFLYVSLRLGDSDPSNPWCLFQTIVDHLDLFSIFTTLNENKIFIHIIIYNCLLKMWFVEQYFSNYESLIEKFSKEHLEETD